MAERDVPAEVLAAVRAIPDPDELPARDAAAEQWVAYWTGAADRWQAQADAYDRLVHWAHDTGQPPAVVLAIGDGRAFHREHARQCREQAEQALTDLRCGAPA